METVSVRRVTVISTLIGSFAGGGAGHGRHGKTTLIVGISAISCWTCTAALWSNTAVITRCRRRKWYRAWDPEQQVAKLMVEKHDPPILVDC